MERRSDRGLIASAEALRLFYLTYQLRPTNAGLLQRVHSLLNTHGQLLLCCDSGSDREARHLSLLESHIESLTESLRNDDWPRLDAILGGLEDEVAVADWVLADPENSEFQDE
jgi:hypothetical protein